MGKFTSEKEEVYSHASVKTEINAGIPVYRSTQINIEDS
jgi:hypothetical protein